MPQTHAVPSFSLSLCNDALSHFGGENPASELGQAVAALRNERYYPPFSTALCDEALTHFGGPSTCTELGRAILAVRDEKPRATSNHTRAWLARHGVRVRAMLVSYLEGKLPSSRNLDVIEDHVQTFLLRLVERDTLHDCLADGKEPAPSILRIWVHQSACTEMRGWGVDASLRATRGAKTARDVRHDREVEGWRKPQRKQRGKLSLKTPMTVPSVPSPTPYQPVVSPTPYQEVIRASESGSITSDCYDPDAPSVEDVVAARQVIEVYRRRVVRAFTDSRYTALFDSMVEGEGKRRDLASEHGITSAQVANMIARIREAVTDAAA